MASLRIRVFRDWPYLYEGDIARSYEADYLRNYIDSPDAAIIAALDGDTVVGIASCLPLADQSDSVRKPFEDAGLPLGDYYYYGESVLLPEYRGQGIGVKFFEQREAQAANYKIAAFCAVQRDPDDPRRPADYVALDAFWAKRGYTKQKQLVCTMHWKDVGATGETPHKLTFWTRELHS